MVTAALAAAILVLAGAIVLLFAMFGELNSRVPEMTGRKAFVRPLSDAPIGHVVAKWPAPLEQLNAGDRSVLLALSTACAACEQVAATDSSGYHTLWTLEASGFVQNSASRLVQQPWCSKVTGCLLRFSSPTSVPSPQHWLYRSRPH
jgi:hypothetical protein